MHGLAGWADNYSHHPHMLATIELRELVESYSLHHRIGRESLYQMNRSVSLFTEHLGREATLMDLRPDIVSSWIAAIEKSYAIRTVKGHRANLLTIWRDAANCGHCDFPIRVRAVKVPRPNPVAWTLEELRAILRTCDTFTARLPATIAESKRRDKTAKKTGPVAGVYFGALIRTAYESGLRMSDLNELRRSQIQPDGTLSITQHKTGDPHTAVLTDKTMRLLAELPGERPLRWWLAESTMYRELDKILSAAGVRRIGGLHAVRRTGATQVAIAHPEKVQRFLGHRTPGCQLHYIDRSQIPGAAVKPRAI